MDKNSTIAMIKILQGKVVTQTIYPRGTNFLHYICAEITTVGSQKIEMKKK